MFMILRGWTTGQRLGSVWLRGHSVTLTVSSNHTTLLVEYHRSNEPPLLLAILRVNDRGQIRWHWSNRDDARRLIVRYPGLTPLVHERATCLWNHVAHWEPLPPGVAATLGEGPPPTPRRVETDTVLLPLVAVAA
jgi:hypothetical protein